MEFTVYTITHFACVHLGLGTRLYLWHVATVAGGVEAVATSCSRAAAIISRILMLPVLPTAKILSHPISAHVQVRL